MLAAVGWIALRRRLCKAMKLFCWSAVSAALPRPINIRAKVAAESLFILGQTMDYEHADTSQYRNGNATYVTRDALHEPVLQCQNAHVCRHHESTGKQQLPARSFVMNASVSGRRFTTEAPRRWRA